MTTDANTQPDSEREIARLLEDPATPRWLKELDQFLPVKSQFVLYGNIRDRYPVALGGGTYFMCTAQEMLVDHLAMRGYKHFFAVNPLERVTILAPSDVDPRRASQQTVEWLERGGLTTPTGLRFEVDHKDQAWRAAASFPVAVEFAESVARNTQAHCAVFFDYLMGQTEGGQTKDSNPFVRSLIASYEARPMPLGEHSFFNTVIWLCDRDNDLPAWFALNNPRVRSISLSKPDAKTRSLVANSLLVQIPGFDGLAPELQRKTIDDFSAQTDGLLMSDLEAIVQFIPAQKLNVTEVAEAARRYKLGVKEDPWRKINKETLQKAEAMIRARVKGQGQAIDKTLDILRRATIGLAGAQASRGTAKPKGVLFFAGPTGVGKTELAKSVTEALFGDETAYIRFDMSEFNHEHSDQRLIGAPPGYVGFEAGGELTAAIRERPFSVVLFDEIEKAHGRILDKFLQILDDGQLTSGRGERVYFSDAVIVFTSNLGMSEVVPTDDYPMVERKLREGIRAYFHEKLNRPELLNRIGDNIVVFDFIRPAVALEILAKIGPKHPGPHSRYA